MICVIRARLTCDIAAVCHTPGRTEEFERYQLRGAMRSMAAPPECSEGRAEPVSSLAPPDFMWHVYRSVPKLIRACFRQRWSRTCTLRWRVEVVLEGSRVDKMGHDGAQKDMSDARQARETKQRGRDSLKQPVDSSR